MLLQGSACYMQDVTAKSVYVTWKTLQRSACYCRVVHVTCKTLQQSLYMLHGRRYSVVHVTWKTLQCNACYTTWKTLQGSALHARSYTYCMLHGRDYSFVHVNVGFGLVGGCG